MLVSIKCNYYCIAVQTVRFNGINGPCLQPKECPRSDLKFQDEIVAVA